MTYSPQTNTCLATNCREGFCPTEWSFFPRKSRRTFCSNGWGPGQGPFMVVVFLGLIFEQCKGWQIFLHNVLIYIWTKTDSQRCSITKQLGLLVPQNYHKYRVFLWGGGVTGPCSFFFSSGIMLVAPKNRLPASISFSLFFAKLTYRNHVTHYVAKLELEFFHCLWWIWYLNNLPKVDKLTSGFFFSPTTLVIFFQKSNRPTNEMPWSLDFSLRSSPNISGT